jgi:hypothetical protein
MVAAKSELARPMTGRLGLSINEPSACCACTAAAACLTSDEADIDLCNMTSDILRFFNIGFLWRKELHFESRLAGSEVCWWLFRLAGWSGPYNQVTSTSFNLWQVSTFMLS